MLQRVNIILTPTVHDCIQCTVRYRCADLQHWPCGLHGALCSTHRQLA